MDSQARHPGMSMNKVMKSEALVSEFRGALERTAPVKRP